ncbi:hypothetical protein C8J56DRAFT_11868 [Mycena floridula]|nr:hypothetical protein C8J56DRAFT_11868 [Mycena floridula]
MDELFLCDNVPTNPELTGPRYLSPPQLDDSLLNVLENGNQNTNTGPGWSISLPEIDHPSDLDVQHFGFDSVRLPSNEVTVQVALGQEQPGAAAAQPWVWKHSPILRESEDMEEYSSLTKEATPPSPQETTTPRLGTFSEFINPSIAAPSDHDDHINQAKVISSSVPVPSRPFACRDCDQGFNREADLNRHFQSPKHVGQTGPQYICSGCNRRYWRKDSLQRHWRKTSGICQSQARQQFYS